MATTEILPNGNIRVRVNYVFCYQSGRKRFLTKEAENLDLPVLTSIARAYQWPEAIDKGEFRSIQELADSLDVDQSYVARTIRLAYLSPQIIRLFLLGKAPSGLSLSRLLRTFPVDWKKQETLFGIQTA